MSYKVPWWSLTQASGRPRSLTLFFVLSAGLALMSVGMLFVDVRAALMAFGVLAVMWALMLVVYVSNGRSWNARSVPVRPDR